MSLPSIRQYEEERQQTIKYKPYVRLAFFLLVFIVPFLLSLFTGIFGEETRREAIIWCFVFVIAAGLLPMLVIAYLLWPAQTRYERVNEVINRVNTWIRETRKKKARKEDTEYAEVTIRSTAERIIDQYESKNYITPVVFLIVVTMTGFLLMFANALPIDQLAIPKIYALLKDVPENIYYGFIGGWFFALYAIVSRYRTADIPPRLVLSLGYQILLSGAAAYFVVELSPEMIDPLIAFSVGFVPYAEIVKWMRNSARNAIGERRAQSGDREADLVRIQARREATESDSLLYVPGLSQDDQDHLLEQNIDTVQDLALANPVLLYLTTSFRMSQIVAWINYAYLRTFYDAERARKLASMGIRGAIGLADLKARLNAPKKADSAKALVNEMSLEIEQSKVGLMNVIDTSARDSRVRFLKLLWNEYGGS